MALGALPLRDEVEHVHLKKNRVSVCGRGRTRAHMQTNTADSKAMREARRVLRQDRMRCRDEKQAGRAGPPECYAVEAASEAAASEAQAASPPACCSTAEDASVAGWDMVRDASDAGWEMPDEEEHSHSPPSCRPPYTSRTRAQCTVS